MQKNSKIDVRDKSPKSINSIYGIENREKARNRCMRDNGLHFTVSQQKKPEVWKGVWKTSLRGKSCRVESLKLQKK